MLGDYIEMLCYRRPGRSETEEIFIEKYIDSLGCLKDEFGNRYIRIGTAPVMWSCHTDTVHRQEGTQTVGVKGNIVSIGERSKVNSNCLGADCTTGVWIMSKMIQAGKEGLYIFHRDEESGGQGSHWIVDNTPELVKDIQFAIAFDRYGTTSIITHQCGRCCSDDFADSMIEQMNGFRKDPGGIFTDTAFYVDLIPECTNVSVGYLGHHTSNETQNLMFLQHVLDLMLSLDISKLRASRDPSAIPEKENFSWASAYGLDGYDDFFMGDAKEEEVPDEAITYHRATLDEEAMVQLIKSNPEAAAGLFRLYGISTQELMEHAFSTNSMHVFAA